MHPKKGRSSAAKRLLLGHLDADEVPLTERQPCGTSWSEGLLVDVSSSTNASHLATGDSLEMKASEQQGWKPSQPSPCAPSCATANMKEDFALDFSNTSSLSQMPRMHKWSPMSLVQVSIIVVALAVAVVITLVFTLRDKGDDSLETVGDQFYSGFTVGSVAKGTRSTAVTRRYLLPVVSSGHHDGQGGDELPKQGAVSSLFTSRNSNKSRRSAYGSPQAVPRSSTLGIVWGNDDGFGPGRFPFPALDSAMMRREERGQRDSGEMRGKKAPTAVEGTPGIPSPSSNQGGGFNEFERLERRPGRVNS